MNDFQLVTNRETIEQLSEEIKKYICGMEFPFAFLYRGNPLIGGELEFCEDNSVYMRMMRSFNPGKGNGRQFIDYLKNLEHVSEIFGESVADAVAFWHKMGATFETSAFEEFLNETDLEEGFLVPFTIAC